MKRIISISFLLYCLSFCLLAQPASYSSSSNTGTHVGYEYVDLGLSVKWATCNLGANSPDEQGDYYAWGETETYYITLKTKTHINPIEWKSGYHDGYVLSNYKWCNGIDPYEDGGALTKYNTMSHLGKVDNKTVLDLCDDVAHVKLGGKWRMPTIEEWTELKDSCTWTTVYDEWDFCYGYKVTSNMPGYTDKYIFLPFAGYFSGPNDYYWSSSLSTEFPNSACALGLETYCVYITNEDRFFGLPVRPVCP